jgi:hypothetical protein
MIQRLKEWTLLSTLKLPTIISPGKREISQDKGLVGMFKVLASKVLLHFLFLWQAFMSKALRLTCEMQILSYCVTLI